MDEITPVRRAEMSPKQNSATIQTSNYTYSLTSLHDQSKVHGTEAFM